ncbi:Flagellar hook-associated protein FlgL [Dissulfuribacter thermophilus]|uniref:Flagellar hook-associated protein FlgL n=1 Tax=Dissulfuribacter thermophilus TaxID=1156395 RepID=A0A1B9F6J6_9BACT|nr:flagellar hook-associated protein FlgL [Dissulfuribacter thermophilus]OCC15559.1 Flagellar hook-associated protein FlgL [Dissulfuribacter thermophilus]
MRVTVANIFNQIKTDLGNITEEMSLKTSQISSGKIYRRPSDAPVALTHALSIRSSISVTNQVQRNIVYGQGWTRSTEEVLNQVQERLTRAKTLAIQGANDTQNADTRRAIAEEVKGILEELVSLGNTRFGGRYLFGGTKTKGYDRGQAPFVLGQDGKVQYLGNRDNFEITVADGLTKVINIDGDTAFMQGGVFDSVSKLYDSLVSNSQEDIDASIGAIDEALKNISVQISKAGSISGSLERLESMADSLELTDKERLSDIEDIDMVEAATDLTRLQTSYQASLAAASKIMQLSLADFI